MLISRSSPQQVSAPSDSAQQCSGTLLHCSRAVAELNTVDDKTRANQTYADRRKTNVCVPKKFFKWQFSREWISLWLTFFQNSGVALVKLRTHDEATRRAERKYATRKCFIEYYVIAKNGRAFNPYMSTFIISEACYWEKKKMKHFTPTWTI